MSALPTAESAEAPRCPICGASAPRVLARHRSPYRDIEYQLRACDGCGAWHWTPLEHPDADYYEQDQEAMYAAIHEGRRKVADPRFAHFFQRAPDVRGKSILDVGCSDGAFLSLARERGAGPLRGIDIDARAVAIARERGLDATVSTVDELVRSSAPGAYDVVTLFDVLEHLVDPVGTLRALGPLLRPGGTLAVTVPNRERLLAMQINSDFPPHHFVKFDRAALRATLEHAGFRPGSVEVFQWGYASTVALDLLRRRVMGALRKRQGGRPERGAGASRAAHAGRARSKDAVAEAIFSVVRPLSRVVERATGRGFKLFVLARSS